MEEPGHGRGGLAHLVGDGGERQPGQVSPLDRLPLSVRELVQGGGEPDELLGTVPGADTLDFRDVEAFGSDTAYLLSADPGDESCIYKTTDGGNTWKLQFKSAEPKAFFDAIAFWDERHGIALSDLIDGRFHDASVPSAAGRSTRRC